MYLQPKAPGAAQSALPMLLTRYVTGQITDTTWERFMEIIDANEASLQERMALAEFYGHAVAELGVNAITVPKLEEVQELLAETRVAGSAS